MRTAQHVNHALSLRAAERRSYLIPILGITSLAYSLLGMAHELHKISYALRFTYHVLR
jgi:hypothetical protein